MEEGARILSDANIPVFKYPDDAAKTFALMWKYSQNIRSLYETPDIGEGLLETNGEQNKAHVLLDTVQQSGRTLLTEEESKKFSGYYGLPIVETLSARSSQEAVSLAEKIGYPVVLKLHSESITHKTDVGGVS